MIELFKKRINSNSMVLFTEQLAAMISANLPLLDVLINISNETMDKRLQEVLEEVCDRLEAGEDISDIFEDYPEAFDDVYVNMVRAGMNIGNLNEALEQLALHMKQIQQTKGKLMSAISYPLFLICALITVLVIMLKLILPNFKTMYANFGHALPKPTQILLSFSGMVEKWGILIFIMIIVTGFIWFAYIMTPQGRYVWDRYKIMLPFVGALFNKIAYSRFMHTMAVLIQNQVPLVTTLQLAAPASGNRFIESIILDASDLVEMGSSLFESFRQKEVFPGIILQMVSAGEEGGILDRLLFSAAHYYDKQVEVRLDTVLGLLNPILTVFVGMIITGILIALFLPVFSMGSHIK